MNNEVNKALFIVNKYSGSKYQPGIDGAIINFCDQKEIEYVIKFTEGRGHATELAKNAVVENRYQCVIAVGGDGTINEVANGLLNSALPMGIIPKGSGNGLARHLGIPIKTTRALEALFNSEVIAMDTFTLNNKLSLNVSGIGFDGHIAHLFSHDKKRGLRGYAKLTFNEFMQFKEFEAELSIGGKILNRKVFIIAIANSSQYGNNARIAPNASVCDKLLHISLLRKIPPYRLDFLYNFFSGKINQSSYCEILETKDLTIKINIPTAFHVDGEPIGESNQFTIELLPHSLQVLIPKTSSNY